MHIPHEVRSLFNAPRMTWKKRGRSVQLRLLLIVLALGLPFVGYFGISAARQAKQERAALGQQMLGVARVTAARLDDHIGDIRQVLVLLSAVVETGPLAAEHNDLLLRGLSKRLPAQTANVSVWNAQGRNIGSLQPPLQQADASKRTFFVDALAGTELALEAPVTAGAGAGDPVLSMFAVPIERDGQIVGVMALASELKHLQNLLAPGRPFSEGQVITVTSASGTVLARSIDPEHWIGRNLVSAGGPIAESLKLRDGVRDGPSADGVERIAGFTTAARVPWRVYVGVPVDAALAAVRSRLHESLVIAATLMALGLLLSTLAAHRIARPLQQLEGDAKRFEHGDLSHRTSVVGFAESASLASTLNRMAEALQQRSVMLESSQSDLRAMLGADVMGIMKIAERRIAWVNAGAERLLGYRPGELIGQTTEVFYADHEAYRLLSEAAYPILNSGQTFRTQQQISRKDGTRIWLDIQAVSLPGKAAETLVMLVDISPLRLAEEARIRTLALESENRQLLESDRLKSAFLSNMSHELRTPLNAVIGLAYLLRSNASSTQPGEFQTYLDHIGSSGQQLLSLIDTMLDFAKAESSKLELKTASVDLRTLIDSVIELHSHDGGKKNIDLLIDIDPAIGPVVIDATRLMQAVSQLLSNAIKFSADGGRVTIRAHAEGAAAFRIEVEDQGIGIPAHDIPLLFAPFRQLSAGSTKKYPGAGLGLALTRRIVEALGGGISVTSSAGAGSVFRVVLPKGASATAAATLDLAV